MTLKKLSDQHLTVKLSFIKSLQLWIPLWLGIYFIATKPTVSLQMLIMNGLIVYFTICLGHCVGLHRYIVHQSFKAPSFIKPIFLLLAALCGFGGPLKWIKFHALRDYWQCEEKAPKAIKYENGI